MLTIKEKKKTSVVLTSDAINTDYQYLMSKRLRIGWSSLNIKPPTIEVSFDDTSDLENFIEDILSKK